jgi:hypothetical protein
VAGTVRSGGRTQADAEHPLIQEVRTMLLREGTMPFPTSVDNGPATAEQVVNFAPAVDNSVVMVSGYDVEITKNFNLDPTVDKWLHQFDVDLRTRSLSGHAIEVTGEFGLRDRSGQWDDRYTGSVGYVVVAPQAEEALGGMLSFPSAKGSGPRGVSEKVQFRADPHDRSAALTGFRLRFTTSDHPLQQMVAELTNSAIAPGEVQVTGSYGLRDGSGNWDDLYDGVLRYAALGIPDGDGATAQLREGRIDFPEHRGSGPQTVSTSVRFPRSIGSCVAALTGFECSFVEGEHNLGRILVAVEARKLTDTEVDVVASLGLRDWSGDWDDPYEGHVSFVVIAE